MNQLHWEFTPRYCKAGRIKAYQLADGIVDWGKEIPSIVRTILINAFWKATMQT